MRSMNPDIPLPIIVQSSGIWLWKTFRYGWRFRIRCTKTHYMPLPAVLQSLRLARDPARLS
jgi:hypothetical protein